MKKLLALILVVVFALTMLAGCENFKKSDTDKDAVSEVDSQFEAGQSYMQEQKYTEAIDAFTQVINLDNTRIDAYMLRGDAYYELAQIENTDENLLFAIADYEVAIANEISAKDTKLYLCYVRLGENAVNNDKKYDALKYYEKAYELDKSDPYVALVQRQYMFKADADFGFDFDYTGFISYGAVISDTPTIEYEITDNTVIITDAKNTKYTWQYNPQTGEFEDVNYGVVEKVLAKDVFNDYYTSTSESEYMSDELYTQYDMNMAAGSSYDAWDRLLNVVYNHLIDVIPEDEAAALSDEQTQWISDREAFKDSESADYTGGSMYPMMRTLAGAEYTMPRVRELIDMIPQV